MKEQLISFNTAKLAKEKGFDNKPCYVVYDGNSKHGKYGEATEYVEDVHDYIMEDCDYLAPTQSLLQKWLREKYKIHLRITQCFFHNLDTMGFQVETEYMGIGNKPKYDTHHAPFKTYEEALEAGLKAALKLIET